MSTARRSILLYVVPFRALRDHPRFRFHTTTSNEDLLGKGPRCARCIQEFVPFGRSFSGGSPTGRSTRGGSPTTSGGPSPGTSTSTARCLILDGSPGGLPAATK